MNQEDQDQISEQLREAAETAHLQAIAFEPIPNREHHAFAYHLQSQTFLKIADIIESVRGE